MVEPMEKFMKAYFGAVKANDRMFKDNANVNGLKITPVGIVDYDNFVRYREEWEREVEMSDARFMERFLNETCVEWERNDPNGEPFAGDAWCPPNGADPPQDAGNRNAAQNAALACSLPYPHHFKLWFIENVLCPSHNESVQALNSFCVLMSDILSRMDGS